MRFIVMTSFCYLYICQMEIGTEQKVQQVVVFFSFFGVLFRGGSHFSRGRCTAAKSLREGGNPFLNVYLLSFKRSQPPGSVKSRAESVEKQGVFLKGKKVQNKEKLWQ